MSSTSSVENGPERWLDQVKRCRYLPESDMAVLCQRLRRQLVRYPSVVRISSPVTVCGDVHGQFYDLMELFKTGGDPKNTRYVFMGDYVDRGYYSLETITVLFLYLYMYPENVTLLRGNHETRRVSMQYGFYDECQQKYGHGMTWKSCCNVFDLLPVAALIDNEYFCVHGGLSPSTESIDALSALRRKVEVPLSGVFTDLLWSDPDEGVDTFYPNQRGAGYIFGKHAVDSFLSSNNISMILRSHQLVMEGFKSMFDGKLGTVWSAPNYCYRCGNSASVYAIKGKDNFEVKMFEAVPEDKRRVPDRIVTPYFL